MKGSVFSVNGRLIKRIEGCPIGDTISVVMSGIYMAKMEHDVVKPKKRYFINAMLMIRMYDAKKVFQTTFS